MSTLFPVPHKSITGTIQLPAMKNKEVAPGIILLEEPALVNGELRALANVYGSLCVISLKITLKQ